MPATPPPLSSASAVRAALADPTQPTGAPAPPDLDWGPLPFIPARHYTAGRPAPISLVVIHTAETACQPLAARGVALWFAGPTSPMASAHYVVGPDEVVQCVREEDTAYGAPGANEQGIHVEHTARAAFTEEEWAGEEAEAMLRSSAALVACICRRYGIPVERVDAAGLRAGASGITGHVDVSEAWRRTTHTDPGGRFQWDRYLTMVREAPPG